MGFRLNRDLGSIDQLGEELLRVRRHLAATAAQLDATVQRIPDPEHLERDDLAKELSQRGSGVPGALIGLELAMADVEAHAGQLLTALQDLRTSGHA